MALEEGDYTAARPLFEESLAMAREVGDKSGISYSLKGIGRVEMAEGDLEAARRLFEEGTALDIEIVDGYMTVASLAWLGGVAIAAGQLERGVKLLGAVEGLRQSMGITLFREDRVPYERAVADARSQLEPGRFERALQEGRAMSMEAAIEYVVREIGDELPTGSSTG